MIKLQGKSKGQAVAYSNAHGNIEILENFKLNEKCKAN